MKNLKNLRIALLVSCVMLSGTVLYNPAHASDTRIIHNESDPPRDIKDDTFENFKYETTGGAVLNNGGTVNVKGEVVFQNNKTTSSTDGYGGAIDNKGTLNITDNVQFKQNISAGSGGAIRNLDTTTINGNNSTVKFSNNSATYIGGAILNEKGTVEINKASFNENKVTGDDTRPDWSADGGAIYNESKGGTAKTTITNATFTSNSARDGGAIYNAVTDFTSELVINSNVKFTGNSATRNGGAIYNAGSATINGSTFENNSAAEHGGAIYNAGTMSISNSKFEAGTDTAKNDIYMAGSSTLEFKDKNTISSAIISETSKSEITNSGNLTINGDASNFTGKFNQESTTSITTVTGNFFGGESIISKGTLNWFTNEKTSDNSKLTIGDEASLLIGKDENATSSLTLKNDSSIAEGASVNIQQYSKLNLLGKSSVTLNSNDNWKGNITLGSADDLSPTPTPTPTLTINKINGNGSIIAYSGTVNLENGNLVLDSESDIQKAVVVNINSATNVNVDGGSLVLDSTTNDTWAGNINLNSGYLTVAGLESNGNIIAEGGQLNIQGATDDENEGVGQLTVNNNSSIAGATKVFVGANSKLNIEGGNVTLNEEDILNGTIKLNSGELTIKNIQSEVIKPKQFVATDGTLNIVNSHIYLDSADYDSSNSDSIAQATKVILNSDSTITVKGEEGKKVGELYLDEKDLWAGAIEVKGGDFTATNILFDTQNGHKWNQDSGETTFKNSVINIRDDNSGVFGGDFGLINSQMNFIGNNTMTMSPDNLYMENSSINMMNGDLEAFEIESEMLVNGTNNFSIDVAPRAGTKGVSDTFFMENLTTDGNGTINISDFNFVGQTPIDRQLKFRVFNADQVDSRVNFTTTNKEISTPIGYYNIQSAGGGWFTSNLTRYNPQVFRGQVATLASFNNQLMIDDMLLNHVTLDSERLIAQGRNANTYASTLPQFAPYQYKKEDGGLWFKSYVNFENLSLTQGLKVGNNSYGSLVGADFPVIKLKHGWRLMPTAYIGYNGAHQTFNGVGMYQNGGQGGLMGTFMKNDFIGSIVAYGGGYNNEMSVAGNTDRTGNWFAGTAAKLAYNFHPTKHFTIQPTAFMSYNIFGRQNWGTDFGSMSMNSGLLNGINVAPGMNFIYARETWSVYATFQYMYNINEQVGGRAGNVDLAGVKMEHGYIQYGVGVTKTWKDRLNSFFQIVFRNGGRTGVGFQLGLNYTFDWLNPKSNKAPKANPKQIKKSTTSNKKSQEIKEFQHVGSKTVLKSLSMK